MGIKSDFWKTALFPAKDPSHNPWKPLNSLRGMTVAVDLSTWLHAAIVIDPIPLKLLFDPNKPVYCQEVISFFQRRHDILVERFGIEVVYVFDGAEMPLKKVAKKERKEIKDQQQSIIDSFWDKCYTAPHNVNDEDRMRFEKALKKCVGRTEQLMSMLIEWMKEKGNITFICAPFEAEAQCVYLQHERIVNAIVKTDSDAVILGANRVIFDIDFNELSYRDFLFDIALQSHKHNNDLYPVLKFNRNNLPVIGTLLGSDYKKKMKQLGATTFINILTTLDADKEDSSLWTIEEVREKLEEFGKGENGRGKRFQMDDEWWQEVKVISNLFRHYPVVTQHGNIVPLNDFPDDHQEQDGGWVYKIGIDIMHYLPRNINFTNAISYTNNQSFICGNTSLHKFETYLYGHQHTDDHSLWGKELPLFSWLSVPFEGMPDYILRCWVVAHLGYVPLLPRQELEDVARKLRLVGKKVKGPSQVPVQYCGWSMTEVLDVDGDNDWTHGDWHAIVNDTTKITKLVTSRDLKSAYVGNRNMVTRVMNLIEGGNVRRESLAYRKMRKKVDGSIVYVLRTMVVPSMKSSVKDYSQDEKPVEGYTVYNVFGRIDDNDLTKDIIQCLDYPYSWCGCYDGRMYCSHRLASNAVVYLAQTYSLRDFKIIMDIRSPVQSQNIILNSAFFGREFTHKKRRKLSRLKSLQSISEHSTS